MKMVLFSLPILAVLAACATSYQSQGRSGGYTETQLAENVFRVSFEGNGYTSSERAVDFTLLRSAELVLLNGFHYFRIVDGSSDASYSTTYLVSRPSSSNTIVCFAEKPDDVAVIYDAEFMKRSIRAKYGMESR